MDTITLQKERLALRKDRAKILNDNDAILIDKVESLLYILESVQPVEGFSEGRQAILSEEQKNRVLKRLFSLIEKY